MTQKTRNNQMLEILRFILIVFVVFCHFHLKGTADIYVVALGRSAVPFFLILPVILRTGTTAGRASNG